MGKRKISRMLLIIVCLMLLLPSIAIGKSKDNDTTSIEMESDSSKGKTSLDASKLEKETEPKAVKEMKEKRTFNTRHFLMDDGTMRAEIHQGNLHYQDEANNWEEINTALVDEADIDVTAMKVSKDIAREAKEITSNNKAKAKKGIDRSQTNFRSVKVPFDTIIPKDYSKGYSITKGTDKLTFKPINANKSIGSIDMKEKNRIHYKNVWKHTDVDLIVTNGGVKEFIYLKNENAPKKFSFEVNTKLKEDLRLGELLIEPLWMEDDKGTIKYIQPKIAVEGKKNVLHIEIDTEGMSYPITVDPSVSLYSYGGNSAGASSYSPSTTHPTTLWAGESYNGSTRDIYLSYFKFALNQIPENAQITSAILGAKMSSFEMQPSAYVDIIPYQVTGNWDAQTLTYYNRPSHTTANSGELQRITSNQPWQTVFLYWDVTTMTRSSFENIYTPHSAKKVSMVLYPVGSGGPGTTKRLWMKWTPSMDCSCNLNTLTVNYKTSATNSPPSVSFHASHLPLYTRDNRLEGRYSDPDSDAQVKYRVSGSKIDGTQTYESGEIYSSEGYFNHYFAVPLSQGLWRFKVSVFDGTQWSYETVRDDVVIDSIDAPETNANVPMSEMNKINYGGFSSNTDKVDFFKFTASHTGGNHLSLKNLTGAYSNDIKINVQIFDENLQGIVPLSNSIGHGTSLEIDFNTIAGKVYFIRIANTTTNIGGPYKWAVTPVQNSTNNNTFNYTYDSLGRLQSITHQWGIYSVGTQYIYDQNGNVIKRTSIRTEMR
ncbi:hypothetical protein PAECIP111893_03593 [Paenibacillus plantiphilus]|uniref:Carbohydrate-binding module family 96 domain-containing protein n=1 Tax=Paenibacillus plantiphilus TaxID=2905650 RepID=A0ABN8GTJ8_9BACL|nr:DNRLRE domain-containing protein [Paenibacillus plantiphilus]CAH1212741.1 hypothetical protein PAECIP111893_03593 [Paenibacillus plantiphilus]